MELYVACDICGHRYVFPDDRVGRNSKCKSCGVSFEVCSANFYDPDTSETDEEEADDNDGSSLTPAWDIAKKIGHVVAGLVTLSMLVWMSSLLFRSPQDAMGKNVQPAASTPGQPQTSRFNPSVPQVNPSVPPSNPFAPQVEPIDPRFPGRRPRSSPVPRVHPAPQVPNGPSPPVIDGSIGWPKDEPERPVNPAPRNRMIQE